LAEQLGWAIRGSECRNRISMGRGFQYERLPALVARDALTFWPMSPFGRLCSLIPGFGVKLSAVILAGPTVLSAVAACPPHDGVRRRSVEKRAFGSLWQIAVHSEVIQPVHKGALHAGHIRLTEGLILGNCCACASGAAIPSAVKRIARRVLPVGLCQAGQIDILDCRASCFGLIASVAAA
jgi:hypothetical protein